MASEEDSKPTEQCLYFITMQVQDTSKAITLIRQCQRAPGHPTPHFATSEMIMKKEQHLLFIPGGNGILLLTEETQDAS